MTPEEWTAVRLSLLVATTATLASLPFGIAIAWLLARRQFWGKSLLDTLVHLPLIMPPVVTGYLLLISFGKRGPIGAFLDQALRHRLLLPLDRRGARLRASWASRCWCAPFASRSRRSTRGWNRPPVRSAPTRSGCSPPSPCRSACPA